MEKKLSGKPIASLIKSSIKELISSHGLKPAMCLIQVGKDPSAAYYVQNIINNGEKLGCSVRLTSLPVDALQEDIVNEIQRANSDSDIHGIMLQKPLPSHINETQVVAAINPSKDLDCLHPENLGRILLEQDGVLPCTPLAVLFALIYYQASIQGSRVAILGRSAIVGKPLANMFLWKKSYANASVTVCHSKSTNLDSILKSADIVVAAIGQAEYLKASQIKENSILIDVGINEITTSEGKQTFVGDIDYNSCYDKCLAITPVPGGIGTVTSAILFLNLVRACLVSKGINKTIDDFIDLIFYDKQNEYIHR